MIGLNRFSKESSPKACQGGSDAMVQRRGPAFLVVPLLLLTLFLAGCPKRPATTGAVAPAPTAPAAAPAAMQPATPAAPAPAAAPRPSEFALNANLKTIYFDFDKYDIRP